MFLAETEEQQALRAELRAYFDRLLTPAVREELGQPGEGSPAYVEIVRQMGKDGWLGLGWPEEYGGQGRSAIDQFIFFFEVSRAGAPFPFVTLNTVGPTLMAFGTDEQKQRFLPGILAGEIHFAIGYTEPESGTDLASLRTRAVLDGEEWVINGNKVFTSGANQADYIWLACRTDPDAPKHKGISMIMVPTESAGFKWTPIVTVGSNTTTATYYDDVRVPKENLVGEVNAGWRLITNQLNHERVGLAANTAIAFRLWEEVVDWARATDATPPTSGEPAEAASDQRERSPTGGAGRVPRPAKPLGKMIDVPWVQADLARTHAQLEAMKLLNWRMAAAVGDNSLRPDQSSAVKVYGTETAVAVYRALLGILGAAGYLPAGSPGAVLRGEIEKAGRGAQINTFGGGVNEVQREIVAAAGLGMARTSRTAK
jgi:alkylation response protein AidB-like acyl-CoA dehydrogenase